MWTEEPETQPDHELDPRLCVGPDGLNPNVCVAEGCFNQQCAELGWKPPEKSKMDPIAKGYWCTNCEFFEDEIYSQFEADICNACGCPADSHTCVRVVSEDAVAEGLV